MTEEAYECFLHSEDGRCDKTQFHCDEQVRDCPIIAEEPVVIALRKEVAGLGRYYDCMVEFGVSI